MSEENTSLMARLGPLQVSSRGVMLATIDDVFRFAKAVSISKLCPPGFSETDCFVIIQNGFEVGMAPITALQNTYVVNNRATIFGDMPLALVRQSGLLEDYTQEYVGTAYKDDYACVVTTMRKGMKSPLRTEYSVSEAKEAGLWEKDKSPWKTAPKRMLMFRARGFNLRDNFGDVLKGCSIAELSDDYNGDLNQSGFTHARAANVVEPKYVREQREAAAGEPPAGLKKVSETETFKAAIEEKAAEKLKQEAETKSAELPKRPAARPRMTQPELQTAKAAEAKPEKPAKSPAHAELLNRLREDQMSEERFLLRLLDVGFIDATRDEITSGKFSIDDILTDDLAIVLKNWGQVVLRT